MKTCPKCQRNIEPAGSDALSINANARLLICTGCAGVLHCDSDGRMWALKRPEIENLPVGVQQELTQAARKVGATLVQMVVAVLPGPQEDTISLASSAVPEENRDAVEGLARTLIGQGAVYVYGLRQAVGLDELKKAIRVKGSVTKALAGNIVMAWQSEDDAWSAALAAQDQKKPRLRLVTTGEA